MPLKGVPGSLTPELLYILAKMGHGDSIVIADANFPSDTTALSTAVKEVVRVRGLTSDITRDVLKLMPLDTYHDAPVQVMDRVPADKARSLHVPAYEAIAAVTEGAKMEYVERFEFYERAKKAFAVVQTDDKTLYANVVLFKGVISPEEDEPAQASTTHQQTQQQQHRAHSAPATPAAHVRTHEQQDLHSMSVPAHHQPAQHSHEAHEDKEEAPATLHTPTPPTTAAPSFGSPRSASGADREPPAHSSAPHPTPASSFDFGGLSDQSIAASLGLGLSSSEGGGRTAEPSAPAAAPAASGFDLGGGMGGGMGSFGGPPSSGGFDAPNPSSGFGSLSSSSPPQSLGGGMGGMGDMGGMGSFGAAPSFGESQNSFNSAPSGFGGMGGGDSSGAGAFGSSQGGGFGAPSGGGFGAGPSGGFGEATGGFGAGPGGFGGAQGGGFGAGPTGFGGAPGWM